MKLRNLHGAHTFPFFPICLPLLLTSAHRPFGVLSPTACQVSQLLELGKVCCERLIARCATHGPTVPPAAAERTNYLKFPYRQPSEFFQFTANVRTKTGYMGFVGVDTQETAKKITVFKSACT
jgi:hypothetical protein